MRTATPISYTMLLFVFKVFGLVLTTLAVAQPPVGGLGGKPLGDRRDRVEAMRAAYIARYIDLTADEAKAFWPVYDDYHRELDKNKKDQAMDVFEARMNWSSMTDNEVEKALDQLMQRQYETVEIKKRYHEKFKKVLPIRKVALLYQAEAQFLKELVKLLGNTGGGQGLRRNNPSNPGGGN